MNIFSTLRRWRLCFVVCQLIFFVGFQSVALGDTVSPVPPLPRAKLLPTAPHLQSNAYLLIDYHSDHVLAAHNVEQRVEPASLTKMMTMYVVDQELKAGRLQLDDKVVISKNAWETGGSRMFLEVGSQVPVQELIKGIIIQSGNDASVAIAEHVAGTEQAFSDLMNTYATMLQMKETHFVNATGLPHEDHYSSARDMAILAKALIRDFPESYSIYSQKTYSYQGIEQINRNRLLWQNSNVDGIKTGHTESAGYCLVASEKRNDMRLISVVMGSGSDAMRTNEANKLLNWGFRFFETHLLYKAGQRFQNMRIWSGKSKELEVGFGNDLYITIGQGQYQELQPVVYLPKIIKAPARQGDEIGTYRVELDGKVVLEQKLIALQNIERAGLFRRLSDSLKLTVRSLMEKMNL